ncbi:MAG: class I SAM-dependent methyltransferase [Pseudomonadota bacterium]
MTELEWAVIRLRTQIRLLDWAANELLHEDAPLVLELGLGNGRTYDHLRQRLPDARIEVFDREMKGKLSSRPPEDRFHKGELVTTLAAFEPRGHAQLIHADLGTGDPEHEHRIAAMLLAALPLLAKPGCIIVTSTELPDARFNPVDIADHDPQSRYHVYRFDA